MIEFIKNSIRALLYPIAVALGGEFVAENGSWMYKFLLWVYTEEAISGEYIDYDQ